MPLPPPNDTQYIDERCGLVFPWFTKPFLDQLMHWRLEDKRVFEYGGGHSTIWWARHAKEVVTVECDLLWHHQIWEGLRQNGDTRDETAIILKCRPVIAGEVELKSRYVNAIYEEPGEFDIIIIDGSYRDECIAAALTKIKDGGIIICDNWDQEGVWDSIMGGRLLDPWKANLFVEPSRAGDARPWKTGFWQIYKDERELLGDLYYPKNFFSVTDAYHSHRPMLWMALEHIKPGLVVELGCGYGSTPLLARYCEMQDRAFVSLETNPEYAALFPGMTTKIGDYLWANERRLQYANPDGMLATFEPVTIAFIDSAPGEQRATLLSRWADNATVLIVHDTEPEAEYVYHIQDALYRFKYRCDLLMDGFPQTTAVSNVYDFERWKGVTLGKFKFV